MAKEWPFETTLRNLCWISHIYIYIYAWCCVRKWGALFHFMRSTMLPFTRSIMGCAESGPWNAYVYSVWGGGEPGTSYSRGCAKYRAWSWGTMPKMRLLKAHFALYIWHVLLGWIGCETDFFSQCAKMPRTAGKLGFLHCRCQICNMKVKKAFRKKGQNRFLVAHPSSFLCFFGVAPRFGKKRCFQNRRNFAETTENVVPNWRGRKTQFWHPRVRNGLSWSG